MASIASTNTGYFSGEINYFYRTKTSKDWRPAGIGSLDDYTNLSYDGFDESGDNLLALKPRRAAGAVRGRCWRHRQA